MRAEDLRVPRSAPRPAGVGPTERWLDVNLTKQTLVDRAVKVKKHRAGDAAALDVVVCRD